MAMQDQVQELFSARRGHFLLESGHHGDLWYDLETLCLKPQLVQETADELAASIAQLAADVICGPLVEGAFVGLMVALKLKADFMYSERFARPAQDGLFPAGYRIPEVLRHRLRGRRVAIVNDVTNAGAAVRGTFSDLEECGATVVGIGSLLVLGTAASEFAAGKQVPLITLAQAANQIWTPQQCPLCASGVSLQDVAGFATQLSAASLRA
jgi:orotate phosphoribosyltransferase